MITFLAIVYLLLGIFFAAVGLHVANGERWGTLYLTFFVWLWILAWPAIFFVALFAILVDKARGVR